MKNEKERKRDRERQTDRQTETQTGNFLAKKNQMKYGKVLLTT
jgi:hypothetical protein